MDAARLSISKPDSSWGRLSNLPIGGAGFPACRLVGQAFQPADWWGRLESLPHTRFCSRYFFDPEPRKLKSRLRCFGSSLSAAEIA